jgi:DNA replication protein DnaC
MLMTHQLMPHLKKLKLSGILATLEARHEQAVADDVTYVDFLARLLEDEVERREQKKLQLRLRRATVDAQKTLEAFDFRFNPSVPKRLVHELATCQFVETRRNVLVVGPAGVGKSHLAQALGHEACRRGHNVGFWVTSKLLTHLHAGRADGTHAKRLAAICRVDLLIIDDFGLKPLAHSAVEDLYDVIAERYERGSIVVTSNRDFNEWPALFGDPLIASAALDRLAHDAHRIVIDGSSYRTGRTRKADRGKDAAADSRDAATP